MTVEWRPKKKRIALSDDEDTKHVSENPMHAIFSAGAPNAVAVLYPHSGDQFVVKVNDVVRVLFRETEKQMYPKESHAVITAIHKDHADTAWLYTCRDILTALVMAGVNAKEYLDDREVFEGDLAYSDHADTVEFCNILCVENVQPRHTWRKEFGKHELRPIDCKQTRNGLDEQERRFRDFLLSDVKHMWGTTFGMDLHDSLLHLCEFGNRLDAVPAVAVFKSAVMDEERIKKLDVSPTQPTSQTCDMCNRTQNCTHGLLDYKMGSGCAARANNAINIMKRVWTFRIWVREQRDVTTIDEQQWRARHVSLRNAVLASVRRTPLENYAVLGE